jgi:phosphatidylglycerophosphate synthase
MVIFMLRHLLSRYQLKVGKLFKWLPLHPNHITLLSIAFAALGFLFALQASALSLLSFLFAFLLDGLDGAIARAKSLSSSFGAYLDGISDRIVEFFAILSLLFFPSSGASSYFAFPSFLLPCALILFFGSCMTSFSKAYASHRKAVDCKQAEMLPTLLPRTERVIGIWVCLVLLFLGFYSLLFYLLWVLAIGSILSFLYLQLAVYRISCRARAKGK